MIKISIKIDLKEQELMEHILNLRYSGADKNSLDMLIGVYALGNSWDVDKFLYYAGMLKWKFIVGIVKKRISTFPMVLIWGHETLSGEENE